MDFMNAFASCECDILLFFRVCNIRRNVENVVRKRKSFVDKAVVEIKLWLLFYEQY